MRAEGIECGHSRRLWLYVSRYSGDKPLPAPGEDTWSEAEEERRELPTGERRWNNLALIDPSEEAFNTDTTWAIGSLTETIDYSDTISTEPGSDAANNFVNRVVPFLEEGENNLAFWLVARCYPRGSGEEVSPTVAHAYLTIDVQPGDVARYFESRGPHLPPPQHPEQAELEAQMLAAHGERALKVITTSKEWHVIRHEIHGHPVARRVTALVVAKHFKDPSICSLTANYFTQKYTGQGDVYEETLNHAGLWKPKTANGAAEVAERQEFPCAAVP